MTNLIQRAPDLRGQLRDQIERRLRLGHYPDDVRLMEHGVARAFAVVRTPAREALAMLAHDGMLVRVGRGYRRPDFSVTDIKNVFELRLQLEPYAVELVANRAMAQDIEQIRTTLNGLAEHLDNAQGYMDALSEFRRCLFQTTCNPPLMRLIALYEAQIAFIRSKTLTDESIRRFSLEGNRRLVDAIIRRDLVHAEQEMRTLLMAAQEAIVRMIE